MSGVGLTITLDAAAARAAAPVLHALAAELRRARARGDIDETAFSFGLWAGDLDQLWTRERKAVLRLRYQRGDALDDIWEELKGLPGRPIERGQISIRAAGWGWKRPERATRAPVAPAAQADVEAEAAPVAEQLPVPAPSQNPAAAPALPAIVSREPCAHAKWPQVLAYARAIGCRAKNNEADTAFLARINARRCEMGERPFSLDIAAA